MIARRHGQPATLDSIAADDSQVALLITSLRQGTLDSVAKAFDAYHQRVRVLARRLLWDDAAAEDVVQDVFVSLPRAIRSFRGESRFESFLLAMAVKRVRHYQRSAIRRRRAVDRLAREQWSMGKDPEQNLYSRQLGTRLAYALDQLPLAQRVAFVLCEIEGLTAGDAAPIAGVPEATVRTRMFHARRKLRDLLVEERAE